MGGHEAAEGRHTIVVGFDGSEIATRAVHWAAGRARARGAELRVLTSMAKGRRGRTHPEDVDAWQGVRLAESDGALDPPARGVDTSDEPDRALVRESRTCDLLVIGTHGHLGPVDALLGSTSRAVAMHAWCPVLLVGPFAQPTQPRRCVVVAGHDLDAAHVAALSWAVDEGRAAGLPVHLLTPWQRGLPAPWELAADDLRGAGLAHARMAHLATMRRLAAYAGEGLVVTGELAHGNVGQVLDRYTERDDLVVLARSTGRALEPALEQARGVVLVVPPHPLRTAWSTHVPSADLPVPAGGNPR